MEPDRPGWYRDPRRPGGRRYWDGQEWVDVDQVMEGHSEPGPVTTHPLLIRQRGAEGEPPEAVDESHGELDAESFPD